MLQLFEDLLLDEVMKRRVSPHCFMLLARRPTASASRDARHLPCAKYGAKWPALGENENLRGGKRALT